MVIVVGIAVFLFLVLFLVDFEVVEKGDGSPTVEELEVSLPRGADYSYEVEFNEMEKITVECEKCDKKNECFFICANECYDKNMFLSGVLPLLVPELDNEGECPCLCRPLVHINELRFVKAIGNKDVTECEKIDIEIADLGKDNCYLSFANTFLNESICSKITNASLVNACYVYLSVLKKDVGLCENIIEDGTLRWNQTSCEDVLKSGREFSFAIPK